MCSSLCLALVNDATGFHYEQRSNAEGRFAFALLPPGDYSARASADKMSPQLSSNLRVILGQVTKIEFKLQIAGVRESITVSAEASPLENAAPWLVRRD